MNHRLEQIFKLHSEYKPTGDLPQAIEALVKGFHVIHFVSKQTSFSTTFDTKNSNLDWVERVK